MTFDQLMQHAKDITDKAVELKWKELSGKGATASAGNPDREAIRRSFAFIGSMFEPFSRLPDPARYDPLIADLNAAMGKLNTGSVDNTDLSKDVTLANPHLDKMITDGGYLQGWTGDAAMAFKANFIDPFKTISGNQFTVLSTLKGVLQAHREMWVKARDDIDKIAENTRMHSTTRAVVAKTSGVSGSQCSLRSSRSVAWLLQSRLQVRGCRWRFRPLEPSRRSAVQA